MKELIRITSNEEGKRLVSARELHEFLESKQDFTTWIKSKIDKYEFIENEDFTLHKFMEGKVWKHEYAITTDMAKELAMVENNQKGKEARKYFIRVEENFKEELLRIQDKAYRKIGELEMKVQTLEEKIPKPVLIAKREIDIVKLFNYINELSGDGYLFNEMYYKIDRYKDILLIDIRKTYKELRKHYKDVEMFKAQPIAIEDALSKQSFCDEVYLVGRVLNDNYQSYTTHVARIYINKLEEAGACIDNLH